jgi:hypothetical protein
MFFIPAIIGNSVLGSVIATAIPPGKPIDNTPPPKTNTTSTTQKK